MRPSRRRCWTLTAALSLVVSLVTVVGVRPAGAATCTIVPNPTPTNHTECAGMDLAHLLLENKNLAYADFSDAWLWQSSFFGSNLHGATFDGANLLQGNLARTNLTDASLRSTGLSHMTLAWTDASRADFTGADLGHTTLYDGSFIDADFTDASLLGADVSDLTTFAGATLTRSDFSETTRGGFPFMPPNQSVGATSAAGKVVSWAAPGSMPGVTGGGCDHASGSVFPVGTTTVTCVVDDDHGNHGSATFVVAVTSVIPEVVPGSASVSEGDPLTTTTLFVPVTLSTASDLTVTVQWATVTAPGAPAGQASPPNDYIAASGTVTFSPGQTSKTVPVVVKGDATAEADEYIVVSFGNPTNAVMGGFWGLGFGGITNDDAPPIVLPGGATVTEGDAGTSVLEIPVTLSRPSDKTVTVDWSTRFDPAWGPEAAVPGLDYEAGSGSLTFTPGETAQPVSIIVHGDMSVESDELLAVAFSNPANAVVGGFWGLGFGGIADDD